MKRLSRTSAIVLFAGVATAALGGVGGAIAADDPTVGRIQKRQAQNRTAYHRCARFALRVYQGGLSQAGNNSAKIRAARRHYQANLARCRALL